MKNEKNMDWSKLVRECLDSTAMAVLATREESGVWATPIYFSYDKEFNLYFISPAETRHMKDIKRDQHVAVAIFMPSSASGIHQVGLQMDGKATMVPDKQIEDIYALRAKRMNRDIDWVPVPMEGHFVKEHGGVFMKITPTSINYVDTRYFGGNSKRIPLEKISKA